MTIGVLALQGAFVEHIHVIRSLGHKAIEVRTEKELNQIDGLIIPGGESTAMGKLLQSSSLKEQLNIKIAEGLPVWGTCAGLILLANKIEGTDTVHIGGINITAHRNVYGSQLNSFVADIDIKGLEDKYPAVFIRAPYISEYSSDVKVFALHDQKVVAARQNNIWVTSFHPELTSDKRLHQLFIGTICANQK